jgi:hypothetical protein
MRMQMWRLTRLRNELHFHFVGAAEECSAFTTGNTARTQVGGLRESASSGREVNPESVRSYAFLTETFYGDRLGLDSHPF